MSKYPGRIISNLAPAGYSVYFDGTGDYLSVANNAALNVGSGDFCIEAWFNVSTVASQQSIVSNAGASGSDNTQIDIVSGNIRFASSATVWLTGSAVTTNTWNHVVVSRSGTTMSLFLNGSRQATATNSTNFANANNYATIVGGYPPSTALFTGYISNVRIVKGSSVYDPTQTTLRVPTQLLNITNTSLLTCQSPAIIDNSTNNFTITANGNAAVSTLTPFPAYVPYNPALGASTPGVWTVDEAMQAAATRQWNMYDPYFNLTTLLLHGNGTNGTQNNTFQDSSTNNFSITRNPTTGPNAPTQGSYSPFSQTGWSVFFNNAVYTNIYAASSADFNFGSGDFTIECFFNSSNAMSTATFYRLFDTGQLSCFFYNGSIYLRNAAASELVTVVAHGLSVGVWYHLAIVRSGTTYSIYRNGVLLTSGTGGTITSASAPFVIGTNTSYNQPLFGYVSNFRVTTGQALYTTAFTPATTSLTTTSQSATASNVKLLTCQSNRFVDNSTQNTKTILFGDNAGNPGTRFIQPFSPFLPTVAYTPQTIGGSVYLDGTDDYLEVNGGSSLAFGSGDFSLEAFVYPTTSSGVRKIYDARDGSATNCPVLHIDGDKAKFYVDTTTLITGALPVPANAWTHVLVSRVSGNLRMFINGVQDGSAVSNATNFANPTARPQIGVRGTSPKSDRFTGYISNLRVLIGSGFTSVTVPTAPLTAITNTSLLLNFTNAGIVDSTGDNVLETVGNAQISTTQSKFGGSSMFFDGSTGRLITPNNQLFNFGASDFTIEGWFYTGSSATMLVLYSTLNQAKTDTLALQFSGGTAGAYASAAGGGVWGILNGTNMGTLTLNAWNHVALVRSGSTWNGYVNGIRGSGFPVTNSSALASIDGFVIGEAAGAGFWYSGYIDELRITRGYARYTGNFTPQTSQWQDQ